VLGYLREEQLTMLLLPIGHLNKSDVRAEAERVGLRTWDKPDSQDVCFIEASRAVKYFFARAPTSPQLPSSTCAPERRSARATRLS